MPLKLPETLFRVLGRGSLSIPLDRQGGKVQIFKRVNIQKTLAGPKGSAKSKGIYCLGN